ncbi:MAG: phasin family protein [Alphaproteobacteria bacterium]|nr:phasin family protein [Alphaproteobacteria bacterium]
MSYNNPFSDAFKNTVDLNELFSTHRRNIEACSAANQAVVEGVQAITRRQSEVMREYVEQVLRASRDLLSSGTPETGLSRQAEYTRGLIESAINNFREVTEMATKCGFEAFDVLNKRASESLDEISRASSATGSRKKAA